MPMPFILDIDQGPQDIFIKEEMFDDGMHGDGSAGDGVYGISIDVSAPDLQYYVYAEKSRCRSFLSP